MDALTGGTPVNVDSSGVGATDYDLIDYKITGRTANMSGLSLFKIFFFIPDSNGRHAVGKD